MTKYTSIYKHSKKKKQGVHEKEFEADFCV